MKKMVLTAVVTACLALVQGGVAGADPDTGSGTGGSPGKTPPGTGQTNTNATAAPAPATDSLSDAPTAKVGSDPVDTPADGGASKLGSAPTGSLSPKTKSTLATETARVDKDMAEVTAAVEQIHNDPAMSREAVQAADAEADVLAREQQIIHEIAVEEGFEPTPETVPAASGPESPATQPAVNRAAVTGDLNAALALLDSRNSVPSPDPDRPAARRAQLAPLVDALRAAEQSGDPQAIENAKAAIESAHSVDELAVLQQTTARLMADADRVLQGYTIPDGIIANQR
ncbi:hypothetical protein [Mycolicibacterium sp. P1-5]|uniref:hypothetical protein n=1 Tax=Mycolicibacterium sp. P1-5 TaxID=2024617 RepID=UPI0011EBBCC0|nr:hypothetical protein [Mycolicibacterium sp. P1-5]KAA0110629.1 hypothetical protein CIW47_06330 [Mycolicibacterium sp. P1-5]